jgi:glyoxylase-like metal-dependent hydrolase (beta-lactamase superfamily II)
MATNSYHYSGADLNIKKLVVGQYSNNCYIVSDPATKAGVIIDTPFEPERIIAEAKGIDVKYILLTHSHMDHIQAWDTLRAAFSGAAAGVHAADADKLPTKPDFLLKDGQKLAFGRVWLNAIHTPGHTPGGVCFLYGGHLFSGDVLFPDGPGHTASGEDLRQLIGSITSRLFVLPDDVRVYPGHGADAVLGEEKRKYQVFASKQHAPDLHGDIVWTTS